MLQRTVRGLGIAAPVVGRRKRRGLTKKSSTRPGMPDVPRSAAGFVFQQLRPRLPARWQYGWRWNSLKGLWLIGWVSFISYLAYAMFFKYTDEQIAQQAMQYTYVRNEEGQVVDIGFKPVVEAGRRARKRADRLLDPDEED